MLGQGRYSRMLGSLTLRLCARPCALTKSPARGVPSPVRRYSRILGRFLGLSFCVLLHVLDAMVGAGEVTVKRGAVDPAGIWRRMGRVRGPDVGGESEIV